MVNSRSLALCLLLFSLASQSDADITGRIHVVDGDTIRVSVQVVRLFGVDAPEVKQTCQTSEGLHWACGAWVSDVLRNAFDGQEAFCVEVEQDRYGRSVARCEVAGVDLGRWLVQRGLAFSYRKYSMDYDLDEKRAAVNDRGLHAPVCRTPRTSGRRARRLRRKPQTLAARSKATFPPKGCGFIICEGKNSMSAHALARLRANDGFVLRQRPKPRVGGERGARAFVHI